MQFFVLIKETLFKKFKLEPNKTPEAGCQPPCSDVKPEPVVTTAEPGPDNAADMPQTTVKGR